jgi:putative N-acetyltransferase (TIGR04045 family)
MICVEGPLDATMTGTPAESWPAYRPCAFHVKRAARGWEIEQAMVLRRAVFCLEQAIFARDDRDAIDDRVQDDAAPAYLLVAVSMLGGAPDAVVGTVRVHEAEPGLWWGSRLAVHAAFRQHGQLGSTLIRLAVGSARARGCRRFLAQVQEQNVALFERLGWRALGRQTLHGREHCLMQADLQAFAPMADPDAGVVARPVAGRHHADRVGPC